MFSLSLPVLSLGDLLLLFHLLVIFISPSLSPSSLSPSVPHSFPPFLSLSSSSLSHSLVSYLSPSLIFSFLKKRFFLNVWMPAYLCAPHACLVPTEARRQQILRSCSHWWDLQNWKPIDKKAASVWVWCLCGFISYSTTAPLARSPSYHVFMAYQDTGTHRKHYLTLSVFYLRGKQERRENEGRERREGEKRGERRLPEMNPRPSFCLHSFAHLFLFCSWYLRGWI